jgi:molybdopterin converting factor small subunit
MTITVLLFASYADVFGRGRLRVPLAPGATVEDLVAQIRADAGGHRLPPRPLVAINHQYATYDRVVDEHDEVALIPPVAGG